MKVNHNQYICDRCGKKIRPNKVYDLCPECDKYLEENYGKKKENNSGGINNAENETTKSYES